MRASTTLVVGEALPAGEERTASVRGAMAALSLSVLLASLGASSANVALPTLAQSLAATVQEVQWVVLAYLLAITSLIVSVGRLGDLIGRRRLLLTGLVLFAAASGLSGIAPSIWLLVLARAVQGFGAAIMMALALAVATETVPKPETGRAMGLLGTMSAIGTALGPSLGGVLIAALGWRTVFAINLPLGLVVLFLVYRYLPDDRQRPQANRTDFDTRGTVLLAVTLAAYALSMTVGGGGFGLLNLALLLAAAVGAGIFAIAERRAAAPLFPLAMLANPVLSAGLATGVLVTTVVMATLVIGPFYLSGVLALDPARIGLVMSSGPIVAALTGVPAGRMVSRFGAGRMVVVGLTAMTVGAFVLPAASTAFGAAGYVAALVALTGGYAVFQAANNTAVMTDGGSDMRGVVSGLLNLSRNLGLITGASVMAAIFAAASGSSDLTSAPPEALEAGMRVTFAVAAALTVVALAVAVGSRTIASRRSLADDGS